jgi:hypothetical protein
LALLKEVNMRRIICLLILISIILTGCANPTKEREEMIQKTFEDAKILNEKSFFGESDHEECKLLVRGNEKSRVALAYILDESKSHYYYFPFNDSNYITQIVLKTSDYHVFGIRVDDDFSTVDKRLKEEGYIKGEINENYKSDIPIVKFSKGYIKISFYIDPTKDPNKISEIVVSASDPKYAGIVY